MWRKTLFFADEEFLEALASAGDSLSNANKNLQAMAKRYMVKVYKPKVKENLTQKSITVFR